MRRRGFLAFAGGAALAPLARAAAQQRPKRLRVGTANVLPLGSRQSPIQSGFVARMAELGYDRGRNFDLEFVKISKSSEYPEAYRRVVARNVDIIVAIGPEVAIRSALAVAGRLPVVMVAVDYDPIARGYVSSLARPTGNVTGLFFEQLELASKRMQLLKEALPGLTAATVFWDRFSAERWREVERSADAVGLRVRGVKLTGEPYDFDGAFAKVEPEFRGALLVSASPLFAYPNRGRITGFAIRHRLPSMFINREFVAAGGLMCYGASFGGMGRRAAEYVDRIARGAKPADLPVERPTQFELVVNLKTANAIGLAVPRAFLLRADAVIE